jgi:hypothetical protein
VLNIGWLFLVFAVISARFGLKLKTNENCPLRSEKVLFRRFCLFTALFQAFQGLLYLTREIDFALVFLFGSYFTLIFSQIAWSFFFYRFSGKVFPRFLVILFLIASIVIVLANVAGLFMSDFRESMFFRNANYPGFNNSIFYDFAPGIEYNFDLVLAFFLHVGLLPFVIWYSYRKGRGLFSRMVWLQLFMVIVLVHDFFAAIHYHAIFYLYAFWALYWIYHYNKELVSLKVAETKA